RVPERGVGGDGERAGQPPARRRVDQHLAGRLRRAGSDARARQPRRRRPVTARTGWDRADPATAVAEAAARCSDWGRWGPDDRVGTLNPVTAEDRAAAARLVRRGAAFSLAQPFDADGPQSGWRRRTNPVHTMLSSGLDSAESQDFPHGLSGAD